jgi:hypothetical protein
MAPKNYTPARFQETTVIKETQQYIIFYTVITWILYSFRLRCHYLLEVRSLDFFKRLASIEQ